MRTPSANVLLAALVVLGCAQDRVSPGDGSGQVVLGPADGRDLPAVDLDRVRVGDPAPNFSLASLAGPVITLSDFRGQKNVILVFYRGYW